MRVKHASALLAPLLVLAACGEGLLEAPEPATEPALDVLPTYTVEPIWGTNYYGAAPAKPYECPYSARDVDFVFRGHSVDTDGVAIRVENLPRGANGLPRAGYRLPPGPWDSHDGEIRIWSGIVRGWCRGRYVSYGFGQIWVGGMHWYEYEGRWSPLEGRSSNDGGGGTYAESSDGASVSDPGAQEALDAFLGGGVCMEGWDIYVDGVQVCDDGIRLY
jgi:hypothetical protein